MIYFELERVIGQTTLIEWHRWVSHSSMCDIKSSEIASNTTNYVCAFSAISQVEKSTDLGAKSEAIFVNFRAQFIHRMLAKSIFFGHLHAPSLFSLHRINIFNSISLQQCSARKQYDGVS